MKLHDKKLIPMIKAMYNIGLIHEGLQYWNQFRTLLTSIGINNGSAGSFELDFRVLAFVKQKYNKKLLK